MSGKSEQMSKQDSPPGADGGEKEEFERLMNDLDSSGQEGDRSAQDGGEVTVPAGEEPTEEVGSEEENRSGSGEIEDSAGESADSASGAAEPAYGGDDVPVIEIIKEAKEEKPPRRLTKKQILERLAEKNKMIFEIAKQLKVSETERKGLIDRLVRTQADFENYRKRSRKEWELHRRTASQELILELLPVLDNFERAQAQSVDSPESLEAGYNLVYQMLLETLAKHGLKPIEADGQPFDPRLHEAFQEIEVEGVPTHQVVEVILRGYYLGDKVLRPARVIVAK